MKSASAGPGASASLLAEVAASWTTARAATFKLPAVTGVTPEPASVREIVATAESARPRRRRRVRVFAKSIAVAFRHGQSWYRASPYQRNYAARPWLGGSIFGFISGGTEYCSTGSTRKPWAGSVRRAVLVGGNEPLLVLFGEDPGSSDHTFGRKFGLTGHEDAALGDHHPLTGSCRLV